jgi:two-component system response regulator DevR
MADFEMTSIERHTRIRVVITADHEGLRLALAELLTSTHDIEVVGCTVTTEAARLTAALSPDIVLMDSGMPVADGRDVVWVLLQAVPDLRIVTLATFRDRHDRCHQGRPSACVLKDASPDELIECIRATAAQAAA